MKHFFFRLCHWISSRVVAIIEWAALLLVGIGVGWWIHPGAGLMTMGVIIIALGIFGRLLALQKKVLDA